MTVSHRYRALDEMHQSLSADAVGLFAGGVDEAKRYGMTPSEYLAFARGVVWALGRVFAAKKSMGK